MTREITTHKCSDLNGSINIVADDEPGPGGANHRYRIFAVDRLGSRNNVTDISFQKGAVKEAGHNGISDEALLAVVQDRLECFQNGPFACTENRCALTHVMDAMDALNRRTRDRVLRGFEGRSLK